MPNAADMLTKAKVQIVVNQPFWATLLFNLPLIEDASLPTGATDGRNIYYNPKFIESLKQQQVNTFLAHEAAHVMLGHHLRMGGRDPQKWNMATDHAINNMLEASNFTPIDGWLCDKAHAKSAAEEIYGKLPDPPPGNPGQKPDPNGNGQGQGKPDPNGQPDPNSQAGRPGAQDPGGCGGVMPMKNEDGSHMDQAQRDHEMEKVKTRVAQAANAAKKAGKLPGALESVIEEYLEPEQTWQEVLSRFVGDFAKEDYTMMRPNRRFLNKGMCLPSLYSETFGRVIFAVDTSCSVSDEEVHGMFNEIMGTLACYDEDPELTVVCCDTKVQSVQRVQYRDQVKIVGRGGTRFSPVMDWLKEHMYDEDEPPVACIYHTDGYCHDFGEDPGIPVLWALSGSHMPVKEFEGNMPFGEVVCIEKEDLTR